MSFAHYVVSSSLRISARTSLTWMIARRFGYTGMSQKQIAKGGTPVKSIGKALLTGLISQLTAYDCLGAAL